MSSNPKQPGEGDSEPMMAVGIMIFVFIIFYLLWTRFHTPIATLYSWLRIAQYSPFVVLNSGWAGLAGLVAIIASGGLYAVRRVWSLPVKFSAGIGGILILGYLLGNVYSSWFFFFLKSEKSLMQFTHLTQSSLYANLFTFVVIIVPLCIWIARRSINTNITNHKHHGRTKDYTLHTFTDRMAEHYKHLALFRKLDLTNKPINTGKYRMADTEKQFAIKHKLLDRHKDGFKVNRDRAAKVFVDQMTNFWTGYKALSEWELAVIAVLVPRIAATDEAMSDDDYKKALETTERLIIGYWADANKTYDPKLDTFKLDLTEAKKAIRKYGHAPIVKEYFHRHAYVGTVIYAMLSAARTLGVLQPAEFRWLRVVDRQLWLIVDNVGKIVATTEAAATYAHFLHEAKRKRAIEKPMIDSAVKGLIEAVEGYAFSDLEAKEINKQLTEREKAAEVIETISKKESLQLIAMVDWKNNPGENTKHVDFIALKPNGDIYFQCQGEVKRNDRQSDEGMLLASADKNNVVQKILSACSGHKLVTFSTSDLLAIPGIERAAEVIEECKGSEGVDLVGTALIEGVIKEEDVRAELSVRERANLCRLIWIEYQKAAKTANASEKSNG